ncbi:hypothetical protein AJ87_14160 [Rhizobium yanglingense]|nr:hypothetical protein AJ87_14160 [Rhizobium yanglingense]
MMRSIDLNQLTETIAPAARLEDTLLALASRYPDAGLRHPLAQRLLGDRDLMQFDQLLASQCRAKIQIAFADQIQRRIPKIFAVAPIAWPRSLLRNQTGPQARS